MMNVMKRAWEIYRTLEGDRIAKLSQALKEAWAEAKAEKKEEKAVSIPAMIEKLVEMGASRWTMVKTAYISETAEVKLLVLNLIFTSLEEFQVHISMAKKFLTPTESE